jgi:hypothetical protein
MFEEKNDITKQARSLDEKEHREASGSSLYFVAQSFLFIL